MIEFLIMIPFLLIALSMAFLTWYQINRISLIIDSVFGRNSKEPYKTWYGDKITIQIPSRNELPIAIECLVKWCDAQDYNNFEIQVVDDSDIKEIVESNTANSIGEWSRSEHNIKYIHRDNPTMAKGGALNNAMVTANGELIAIFDVDHWPDSEFLSKMVYPFTQDPLLGLIQARWVVRNRDTNWLTRVLTMSNDAYFDVEIDGRYKGNKIVSFCGTSGVLRKAFIEHVGGWKEHAEDTDMSYSMAMEGWHSKYESNVYVSCLVPEKLKYAVLQWHRWRHITLIVGLRHFKNLHRSWRAGSLTFSQYQDSLCRLFEPVKDFIIGLMMVSFILSWGEFFSHSLLLDLMITVIYYLRSPMARVIDLPLTLVWYYISTFVSAVGVPSTIMGKRHKWVVTPK